MKLLKESISILLVFIISFLEGGCIEKEGYYDYNQENIILNLTESKWERKYHDQLDNGVEMNIHEIYSFSKNGSGSFQSITTYMDGKYIIFSLVFYNSQF